MKQIKRILAVLCAVLVFIPYSITAKAASYEYKVTVLAGLHGTINGLDKVEISVPAGTQWTPNAYDVAVTDARFYFKGFHVSGIEDLTTGGAQTITKDIVFVAAYGMSGRTVEYTVLFQDAAGNTLHPQKTFYGNVGDKPVVACEYIDGYVPQAQNLTKTLSANAAENVFTFIYSPGEPLPGGGGGGTTGTTGYTYTDDGTVVIYLPGPAGGNQNAGGNANPAGNQNAVNPNNAAPGNQQDAANPADAANAADANADQAADNAAAPGNDTNVDVIDLDDQTVPLANASPSPDAAVNPVNPKPGLSPVWIAALLASGLGIFALIAILIMLFRKKRKEA